ncbi:DUF4386 domain-containing protein [Glycomyces salinus]|uniref:DUF4386 domain-containing protein n=1 Tax=Glycomyces salinus TaxID=980294 RepID=UPI0018ED6050|nr:DUF4386 domain-containing protein [Glycomyces salinus]
MNNELVRTARVTGALYLGLGLSGILGFMVARSSLYAEGDAEATFANLLEHETLARLALTGEMAVVVTQVLVALWFFRLFRGVNSFAAGSLATFGLMNAVAILTGAAFTATALEVAGGGVGGDDAATVQLMFELNEAAWGIGQLFFGLWLIPMGRLAVRSGYLPRPLGHLLVVGGIVYIAVAFLTYLWPDMPEGLPLGLAMVPTVGEFWTIGYLLIVGVRRKALENTPVTA